ncbi:MAG TPA: glycoside hydrolase family 2 TIM barrel-domain containing protein [Kofleriaceae bacterium]|nr:glycoside hydrolase family 2 TIM barrel-domain containing protein [Kofleriaceae bacterium]
MKYIFLILLATARLAHATEAHVVHDERGYKLQVDGKDTLLRGMNWGYSPIGWNYSYSLWSQSDDFIERVLDRDMGLLRAMGVNAIRQFPDIPPRWVEWIYRRYGIYTVIDDLMGRYGATIDGVWIAKIDYGDPHEREALIDQVVATVEKYKATPGVAMWILGNENNYGLAWTSFEPEALPGPGHEDDARATPLYSLYGEAIRAIKAHDATHPVAIANGDLQFVDLIAKYCVGLDVLGSNVYRGASARDFFDVVEQKLHVPAMFTEFGADAYDAKADREDAVAQAEYLRAQWQEIYEETYGKGRAGNAIGGFVFQWTDGWWKTGQDVNLDVHDTTASWPNDAYPNDFVAGQNNMNEEWFGIAAIESQGADAFYQVQPRVAYYVLRAAFRLDPYADATTIDVIREHFGALHPADFAGEYEGRHALAAAAELSRIRVSGMRMRLESNYTRASAHSDRYRAPRFDHTESLFVDLTMQPTPKITGKVTVSLVGNASQNRLDPLYWENRTPRVIPGAAPATIPTTPAPASPSIDHASIYGAELKAQLPYADVLGYYRVGHTHWGYEGDFFGLYREAYYGAAIDIYHATAPLGLELDGRGAWSDFKLALGPEIYWGANPTAIAKWHHQFKDASLTIMHQEDVAQRTSLATSGTGFEPLTRRSTISVSVPAGPATIDAGAIMAAPQRVGQRYVFTHPASGSGYNGSGYDVYTGRVAWADTLGARARVAYDGGVARWYVEGQYRGLVSDGGPDQTTTWTGWTMKSSGRGNHTSVLGGVLLTFGSLQLAPNVLWQKPIVGPNPIIPDHFDPASGTYFPGVAPRNTLADPFAVLDNRETIGGELLVIYDPTPGTWYWSWDRDRREDAKFACSLDTVYRHQPTSRDATLVILADGSLVPSAAAPPAHDVWQSTFAWIAAVSSHLRLSGTVYAGQDQARAGDPRLVTRGGATFDLIRDGLTFSTIVRVRDWGPYDYHRDFNLTYPLQWYGDLSFGLAKAALGAADARLGVRWELRFLDGYSEGYVSEANAPAAYADEAEALVYFLVSI